jgi:hypothetical protein
MLLALSWSRASMVAYLIHPYLRVCCSPRTMCAVAVHESYQIKLHTCACAFVYVCVQMRECVSCVLMCVCLCM